MSVIGQVHETNNISDTTPKSIKLETVPKHKAEATEPVRRQKQPTRASVRVQSVADILDWVKQNATFDDLVRIEIAAKESQKSLKKKIPKTQVKPRESYHQKEIGGKLYWYKSWTQGGRLHTKYVGTKLPDDLDHSRFSVSERRDLAK